MEKKAPQLNPIEQLAKEAKEAEMKMIQTHNILEEAKLNAPATKQDIANISYSVIDLLTEVGFCLNRLKEINPKVDTLISRQDGKGDGLEAGIFLSGSIVGVCLTMIAGMVVWLVGR